MRLPLRRQVRLKTRGSVRLDEFEQDDSPGYHRGENKEMFNFVHTASMCAS